MTTIYVTSDIVNKVAYYFVPDAATLTEGQTLNIPNTVWAIGNLNVASAQHAINQQTFKRSQAWLPHFSQVKSIGQDADGHNIWAACDITTESENTTILYELFCDVQPEYQTAMGTRPALYLYGQQEQAVLAWAGLSSVITLTALPSLPELLKVKS